MPFLSENFCKLLCTFRNNSAMYGLGIWNDISSQSQRKSISSYLKEITANMCRNNFLGEQRIYEWRIRSLRFILESFPWTRMLLNQGIGPQRYWTFVYPIEDPQAIFNELNIKRASECTRFIPQKAGENLKKTRTIFRIIQELFQNYQNYFGNHRNTMAELFQESQKYQNYIRTTWELSKNYGKTTSRITWITELQTQELPRTCRILWT